ncbi:MAG: MarR family transcriptional regulator [Cyclobacteriaceae bacterium]|nr:MarR family transcriptional regulator [Cyclobacteriaceae bacterium]
MKREDLIDYHIKGAWHAVARMYNQYAMQHHITTSIGFVLLNIDSEEGTPATKIAPLMGMEARSLTRILKSMENKQLIVRKRDLNDGRLVKIFLTPLGRKKQEIAKKTVRTFNQLIHQKIPREKLEVFREVIGKIHEIISTGEITKILNAE